VPVDVAIKRAVKALADSQDKRIRDRGVKFLGRFLVNGAATLTDADFGKVWRGLYFCMWHSDKPLVQEELATALGRLGPAAFRAAGMPSAAVRFAGAFFAEMRLQWDTIDDLRLDKFMRLVRRVLEGVAGVLAAANWDTELVALFCSAVLGRGVLDPTPVRPVPSDLQLHVITILFPVLTAAGEDSSVKRQNDSGENGTTTPTIPLRATDAILDCFLMYAESGPNKTAVDAFHKLILGKMLRKDEQSMSGVECDLEGLRKRAMARGEADGLVPWQRSRMHRIVDHITEAMAPKDRPPRSVLSVKDLAEKMLERLDRLQQPPPSKRMRRNAPMTKRQRKRKLHIAQQRELRKKKEMKRTMPKPKLLMTEDD
jgi:hypothetical protein